MAEDLKIDKKFYEKYVLAIMFMFKFMV